MTSMRQIIIATNNKHKVQEIKQILKLSDFEILDLSSFPDVPSALEDGKTLSENAIKKANHVFKHTGILSIADDTGLFVDYLMGAPGVYSSRYAGENANYEDNNRKLLSEMKGVPPRKRGARFKCLMAIIGNKINIGVEGVIEGKILFNPRGNNGFGYDPLFQLNGYLKSFAEMDIDEKNKISHRAIALNKAREILINL
jgi:XTP/dITP diphosphohydrolase